MIVVVMAPLVGQIEMTSIKFRIVAVTYVVVVSPGGPVGAGFVVGAGALDDLLEVLVFVEGLEDLVDVFPEVLAFVEGFEDLVDVFPVEVALALVLDDRVVPEGLRVDLRLALEVGSTGDIKQLPKLRESGPGVYPGTGVVTSEAWQPLQKL